MAMLNNQRVYAPLLFGSHDAATLQWFRHCSHEWLRCGSPRHVELLSIKTSCLVHGMVYGIGFITKNIIIYVYIYNIYIYKYIYI